MPSFVLRTMFEETSFAEDRARLATSAKRLDEILEAVWLRLSQDAESGTPIGGGLCVTLTAAFPDAPALGITYRFDDDTVYLMGLDLD